MKSLGLTLITFYFSNAIAAETMVSSDTLKALVENKNAKVQAAQKGKEASLEREGSLARSFLPSFEVYAGEEAFKTGRGAQIQQPTYGAEMKVNIFNGGRDALTEKAREIGTSQSDYARQRIISEELEKARSEFWELIYLKERAALLQDSVKVNKQNLSAADRRIRSGVATTSDRMEFEMKAVELARELQETDMKQKRHLRNLKMILGVSGEIALASQEKLDHEHDYEKGLQHRIEDHAFLVKENELLGEQVETLAKRERRAWLPKMDVFAAYNQFNEREKEVPVAQDRTESVVGVRLHLEFSAGMNSWREASALMKEAEAAKTLARFQKSELEVHLSNETEELRFLHNQIHDAEENILRAERYYRLTQSEYARGVKNSPDVLGASEKLFSMRQKRLEIVRDFQVARAHVLSKIGK